MLNGLSGGQRKRTAIGVELITRPDIICLDEPWEPQEASFEASKRPLRGLFFRTSGLDSFAAYQAATK